MKASEARRLCVINEKSAAKRRVEEAAESHRLALFKIKEEKALTKKQVMTKLEDCRWRIAAAAKECLFQIEVPVMENIGKRVMRILKRDGYEVTMRHDTVGVEYRDDFFLKISW